MYVETFSFHTSKIGHLPFGVLLYGNSQLFFELSY